MGRPVTAKMPEKASPRSRPAVRAWGTSCPARSFHKKMVARSQPITSGTVSTTNWTASLRLVTRESCSERRSNARVVTLLRSASARTARDVQGGRRIGGVEIDHSDCGRVRMGAGRNEHRHPAIAPSARGDVHDQPGGVVHTGLFAPELGGQGLLLVGLESSRVDVDRCARVHPDHEDIGIGGHDRVGAGRDVAKQGVRHRPRVVRAMWPRRRRRARPSAVARRRGGSLPAVALRASSSPRTLPFVLSSFGVVTCVVH